MMMLNEGGQQTNGDDESVGVGVGVGVGVTVMLF
jgi:hypothetical protein